MIAGEKINRKVKILYTLWMCVWTPVWFFYYGPAHFLWLCNLTNFIVLAALWREDALLLSSQIVLTLVIDSLWAVDLVSALLFGVHPVGGTKYMFSDTLHIGVRIMSLYHLVLVPLVIYGLWRVGYDNRGWKLQTGVTLVAYPLTYFFADPVLNVNWLWRPFEMEQTLVSLEVFLLVCMAAFPLLLYLPTHGLIRLWLFVRKKYMLSP